MYRLLCVALLPLLAACSLRATLPTPATTALEPTTVVSAPLPIDLPTAELFDRALERRAVGDDEGAADDLLSLMAQQPEPGLARHVAYYLAESYARRGRWASAIEAFKRFLADPTEDEYTQRALFWLARCYEESGAWAEAAEAYRRYRTFNTVLEPYAAMRQAAQQEMLGQLAEAAQEYAYVGAADIDRGERAAGYEKAIALYEQLGQSEQALRLYISLLDIASKPEYRARILSEAAALAERLGQTGQARAWLREIIAIAPATAEAISALQQVTATGDSSLNPAEAAHVYFMHGYYEAAVPWFDAALSQTPPGNEEALELQRLRALCIREQGDLAGALDTLAQVANTSPDTTPGREAHLAWIQTLGQSGDVEQAAQRYYDYSHTYPDDPLAPIALERSALLHDRLGDGEKSAQIRLELGQRYPQHELAPAAFNETGWYFFNTGRMTEARNAWELLASVGEGYERARGAFWAGRIARNQQDEHAAQVLFGMARDAAPNSYYGARATEELGIALQGAVPLGTPMRDQDWQALSDWINSWVGQPAPEDHAQVVAMEVATSGFVRRAIALQQVGLRTEAIAEWNNARDLWKDDPIRLMALAQLAHENSMPYIALKTAEQLADLSPQQAHPLPEALERLIFPTPYAALVLNETRAQGVDPRLFYALLRQESLFNPGATSWVGARGLAQVMPETAAGIAQALGMTDFEVNDLYRPQVSIRFGAFYIGQRISDMEGNVQAGLAAYNGGLGNALRWAGGSTVADADLFTEAIDFAETEGYVKLVYGYYSAYQRLYTLPSSSE